MGVLYSIGNRLVSRQELEERAAFGDFRALAEGSGFSGNDGIAGLATQGGELPFEPIGIGKPLTVELLACYTGDAPGRSFFDFIVGRTKPDMLVVSGVKTPTTFDARHEQ